MKRLHLVLALAIVALGVAIPTAAQAEPQETTKCGTWRYFGSTEARVCLRRDSVNMNGYIQIHNFTSGTVTYHVQPGVNSTMGSTACGIRTPVIASGGTGDSGSCFQRRYSGVEYGAVGSFRYNGTYQPLDPSPTMFG